MSELRDSQVAAVLEYLWQRLDRRNLENNKNPNGGVLIPMDPDNSYRPELFAMLCNGPYEWKDAYKRTIVARLEGFAVEVYFKSEAVASNQESEQKDGSANSTEDPEQEDEFRKKLVKVLTGMFKDGDIQITSSVTVRDDNEIRVNTKVSIDNEVVYEDFSGDFESVYPPSAR